MILNFLDAYARLTETSLNYGLNYHPYEYNNANQGTRQSCGTGNYMDYTYDPIGHLVTSYDVAVINQQKVIKPLRGCRLPISMRSVS